MMDADQNKITEAERRFAEDIVRYHARAVTNTDAILVQNRVIIRVLGVLIVMNLVLLIEVFAVS